MFPYWKILVYIEQPNQKDKKIILEEHLTRAQAAKWMNKEAKRIEREWLDKSHIYRHQILLEDKRISLLYRDKKTEEKVILFRVCMKRISIWEILNFK